MNLIKNRLYLIFILVVTILTYSNSIGGKFLYDDRSAIIENENLRSFESLSRSSPTRFITSLSFFINLSLNGLNPLGFHLVNLLIHLTTVFMVYSLSLLLIKTRVHRANSAFTLFPYLAAVLYAVHPLQTEAVSLLAQRATILAALFYISSLVFYVYYSQSHRIHLLFISLGFSSLAYLSKENSYTLIPVLAVTCHLFARTKGVRSGLNPSKKYLVLIPYLIIAFFTLAVTYLKPLSVYSEQGARVFKMAQGENISRLTYALTQVKVVGTYIRLLAIPLDQNADYDFSMFGKPDFRFFFCAVVILFLISMSLIIKSRHKIISFGIFFFFLSLTVESSVIPIKDVIAEHRLYLPLAGFALSVSYLFCLIAERSAVTHGKLFIRTLIIMAGVVYGFLSFSRNQVWQNDLSLWKDTVVKSPLKARPHYNLGVSLGENRQFEEAKKEFEKTITLDPKYSQAYQNLGYLSQNDFEKAKAYYQKAISLNPQSTSFLDSLASLYAKHNIFDRAEEIYLKALEIEPDSPVILNNYGLVLLSQKKYEAAIEVFLRSIISDPTSENTYLNLSVTYISMGEILKAKDALITLLEINPENEAARKLISKLDD